MANQKEYFAASLVGGWPDAADNNSTDQKDLFWFQPTIKAGNWNVALPYVLVIMEATIDGKGTQGYSERPDLGRFVLPFAPESLERTTPFAISVSATLGGIVEEHNGAPFRMISFSGTTGVLPQRGSNPSRPEPNITETIFAGTIRNANNTVAAAKSVPDNFNGTAAKPTNLIDPSDIAGFSGDATTLGKTSGYYQCLLLERFLENYVNLKKKPSSSAFRLGFAIYKEQAVYLVTPVSFITKQSADSPLEKKYSLQLKAWARINPTVSSSATYLFNPVTKNTNRFAQTLNALQDARRVVESGRATLAAVSGDINNSFFEPVRQMVLFAKDHLGVGLTLADTSVQIARDAKDVVVQLISGQQAVNGFAASFASKGQEFQDTINSIGQLGTKNGQASTAGGWLPASKSFADTPTTNGLYATDPGNDPFTHPEDNFELFDALPHSSLNFPPTTLRRIIKERNDVRNLTRLDFENFRDSFVKLQADFADSVGAGAATYNRTFNRSNVISTKTPTENDFNVMFALNRLILEAGRLAATYETNQFSVDSLNFVAGAASRSGIAFNIPKSKYAIPFPFGVTLEQLAAKYLNNPDRWIEIATLNGLKTPYVDEEGFDIQLLTDGRRDEVTVSDASNLFIGQMVWLSSSATTRTKRNITKITPVGSDYYILTLDGDLDLERYSTLGNATLHAFLPNTVNSMMTIYMPSDSQPGEDDYRTKEIPGLNDFDPFFAAGGVDILLTSTNDLAITPDGDCRLAVGLTNLIQTARITLSVAQGQLNRHPSFGLPIKIGSSTADTTAADLAKAIKHMFDGNPSFSGVSGIRVDKRGPAINISMSLGVRGISQFVPLSLQVTR